MSSVDSFAALADPSRRRIVEMLAHHPLSSGDIASSFEVSASAVSQHLKVLRSAGLVRVRVDAQRRIYELEPQGIDDMAQWLSQIRTFWAGRLEVLKRQLDKGRPT